MSDEVEINERIKIVKSNFTYEERADNCFIAGVKLDSIYEAKTIPYLEDGDLLWTVGIRASEQEGLERTFGPTELTPVEERDGLFFKRDDLVEVNGAYGAKVRGAYMLATSDKTMTGLVTAGARHSPQLSRVARVAYDLGIPSVGVTPDGELTQELVDAQEFGMELVRVKYPSFINVLKKRAIEESAKRFYRYVPFGMEHPLAINLTSKQVESLVGVNFKRIVVPVGSGVTLVGVSKGMKSFGLNQKILGVQVGMDYSKLLKKHESFL